MDQKQELGGDSQQKLELPTSVALAWKDSIRKESQRLSGGFSFHAPTAVSGASTAFWSRCSGPIDEASSGGILRDDVLILGGSVVEGKGLRS